MDRETVQYLIRYFRNLMTEDEKLALNYHMYPNNSDNPDLRRMMIENGWISPAPEITNFVKNDYEEFELTIACRIMAEEPEKVFFNTCPKCNKLARTPYAKQCRYCGYSWRDLVLAKFKIDSVFQITGRQFFLTGQITEGEITEGQRIDLRILGLNKKIKIESIEFVLKRQNEQSWEDIALGTNALTKDDKQYLKSICPIREPLEIVKE